MHRKSYKEHLKAQREQDILRAAGQLLCDHGEVNMDTLAEIVGVSKPTLYQHFHSKHELVARVVLLSTEHLERYLLEHTEGTPIERFEAVMRMLLRQRYAPDSILEGFDPALIVSALHSDPAILACKARLMKMLCQLVDKAKAGGEIVPSIPTRLIVYGMFSTLSALGDRDLPGTVDEAIESVISLFMYGIRPRFTLPQVTI
jgi:AcrR family transcriptional regulator